MCRIHICARPLQLQRVGLRMKIDQNWQVKAIIKNLQLLLCYIKMWLKFKIVSAAEAVRHESV